MYTAESISHVSRNFEIRASQTKYVNPEMYLSVGNIVFRAKYKIGKVDNLIEITNFEYQIQNNLLLIFLNFL